MEKKHDRQLTQESYFDDEVEYFESLQGQQNLHQEQVIDYFIDNLKQYTLDGLILELGGGTGMYTIPLLRRGYDVVSVDVSSKSLEVAQKHAANENLGERLHTVATSIENIQEDGKFDAAVGKHILHHLDSIQVAAEKSYASLKSGGVALFMEPNPLCPYWLLYISIDRKRRWSIEKGILTCWPWHMRGVFRQAGFNEITTKYYGLIPATLTRKFPILGKLNKSLGGIPLLRNFLALQLIIARKD